MNKLSILAILFLLQSCVMDDYKNASFEIKNKSQFYIDSLLVTNHQSDEINSKKAYEFEAKESKSLSIDMTNAEGDGDYIIKYKVKGEWYEKRFGYFTNGSQIEELISIIIIDIDSLLIDYIH